MILCWCNCYWKSRCFFVNLRFNDFEQLFKEFWSNRMKRNAFKWKYSRDFQRWVTLISAQSMSFQWSKNIQQRIVLRQLREDVRSSNWNDKQSQTIWFYWTNFRRDQHSECQEDLIDFFNLTCLIIGKLIRSTNFKCFLLSCSYSAESGSRE
jgi:hypothetical protein